MNTTSGTISSLLAPWTLVLTDVSSQGFSLATQTSTQSDFLVGALLSVAGRMLPCLQVALVLALIFAVVAAYQNYKSFSEDLHTLNRFCKISFFLVQVLKVFLLHFSAVAASKESSTTIQLCSALVPPHCSLACSSLPRCWECKMNFRGFFMYILALYCIPQVRGGLFRFCVSYSNFGS